ncbi:related to GCN3-translation initiation factor eIF2B, 34 KD, alpha subunit [Sporisorium reilianum SRZ2]|uniref:Translation initiation factor eIF2B subunit alpha n=1 Tax=Sporisorium reilianum (strain SRZ2) TaxID=999809 RepID=E7A238_SPORE|nr:related to GCN3-translation initiation factor eIF2B, 34 KD, alpha subunit [Sporisorium reilianum SRZ2]
MAPSASSSSSSAAVPTLLAPSGSSSSTAGNTDEFDIISCYHSLLSSDAELPFPIAAIFALSELVSKSKAATTSELMENIRSASQRLKASLENPVPATAGLDLFTRFVVTKSWDTGDDFEAHKASLAALAHEFAVHTVPSCREKICELVLPFIKDDSVVLTHSYSRVVMQALKFAALHQRKRISVYVTESRPHGLGLRTYDQLIAHAIPCTVLLDSAVAYTMPKVDVVLTGAEGVVESGGFLNAVGTYGMAIIAKACNKPFFALAESFKFLRMFPLNQYDLPTNNSKRHLLAFPDLDAEPAAPAQEEDAAEGTPKLTGDARRSGALMSRHQELLNPAIDYTTPDLVTFLFSDVGVLTPSGVGDALLAVYGGAD